MGKYLIVNADDFGASSGINRGILECHTRGIVTSTSLMVTGRAVEDAKAISRDHQELAIGLHWDIVGEGEHAFDTNNLHSVRDEFHRQMDEFYRLLGRLPTHVDSHRNEHRSKRLMPMFRELVEPLGVPLRGDGRLRFVGGFYAQWEWLVTNLEYVSVPFLQQLLREEVGEGWTELACHPGYLSADFVSAYGREREEEIRSLTSSSVRQTIDDLGIRLLSFADYAKSSNGYSATGRH